jgi:multidrug efflux system outer membrane protein
MTVMPSHWAPWGPEASARTLFSHVCVRGDATPFRRTASQANAASRMPTTISPRPRLLGGLFVCALAATWGVAGRAGAEPSSEPHPGEAAPVTDDMLAPPPEAPRRIASWDEALAVIRAQSPDYGSSYQSVVRAEAQKRIALAAVLPVLTGQGTYTHQFLNEEVTFPTVPPVSFVTPPSDVFGLGATLFWSVVNPRNIYAQGTAARNVDLARLSFEDKRRTIATAVVSAMLSTLAAARVTDLNRVGLRAALERLALTQTRQQFGQGTALDVDRTQQDVEEARALIIASDESLRQSREALGEALGSPVAVSAPGDLDLERFEAAVARTCRLNDDIEKRPDVRARRLQVEIAERSVRDADLQYAPSLNLLSQLNYATQAVLAPQTTLSVEGVVIVPIYDGGARQGARRDARAAVEQARQALVATQVAAIVGSAQAQRAVGVLRASRDVAAQQRDLAERIDRRTRAGYSQGLGTSLDLVTSAQALRQAETNLALLDFQVGQVRANAVLTNAECVY